MIGELQAKMLARHHDNLPLTPNGDISNRGAMAARMDPGKGMFDKPRVRATKGAGRDSPSVLAAAGAEEHLEIVKN